MDKKDKEICICLIEQADKIDMAIAAIRTARPALTIGEISRFVKENWEKAKGSKYINIRNCSEKDIITMLRNLLHKRSSFKIKEIKLWIVKSIDKKVPTDLYDQLLPKRERVGMQNPVRGTEVELIKVTDDGLKILVRTKEKELVLFTIFDINRSKLMKIEQ